MSYAAQRKGGSAAVRRCGREVAGEVMVVYEVEQHTEVAERGRCSVGEAAEQEIQREGREASAQREFLRDVEAAGLQRPYDMLRCAKEGRV